MGKSHARICASWFASLLCSDIWQLRICAILALQRTLAGNMAIHADSIAARLLDDHPFVRQSAALALGCLGRTSSRYSLELIALLAEKSSSIRHASLVTLGCMFTKALPHAPAIAAHLLDESFKCRMAALWAIKCMGQTAMPYTRELWAWRETFGDWVVEPIIGRALCFPDVPLRDIFRGRGRLGLGPGYFPEAH